MRVAALPEGQKACLEGADGGKCFQLETFDGEEIPAVAPKLTEGQRSTGCHPPRRHPFGAISARGLPERAG